MSSTLTAMNPTSVSPSVLHSLYDQSRHSRLASVRAMEREEAARIRKLYQKKKEIKEKAQQARDEELKRMELDREQKRLEEEEAIRRADSLAKEEEAQRLLQQMEMEKQEKIRKLQLNKIRSESRFKNALAIEHNKLASLHSDHARTLDWREERKAIQRQNRDRLQVQLDNKKDVIQFTNTTVVCTPDHKLHSLKSPYSKSLRTPQARDESTSFDSDCKPLRWSPHQPYLEDEIQQPSPCPVPHSHDIKQSNAFQSPPPKSSASASSDTDGQSLTPGTKHNAIMSFHQIQMANAKLYRTRRANKDQTHELLKPKPFELVLKQEGKVISQSIEADQQQQNDQIATAVSSFYSHHQNHLPASAAPTSRSRHPPIPPRVKKQKATPVPVRIPNRAFFQNNNSNQPSSLSDEPEPVIEGGTVVWTIPATHTNDAAPAGENLVRGLQLAEAHKKHRQEAEPNHSTEQEAPSKVVTHTVGNTNSVALHIGDRFNGTEKENSNKLFHNSSVQASSTSTPILNHTTSLSAFSSPLPSASSSHSTSTAGVSTPSASLMTAHVDPLLETKLDKIVQSHIQLPDTQQIALEDTKAKLQPELFSSDHHQNIAFTSPQSSALSSLSFTSPLSLNSSLSFSPAAVLSQENIFNSPQLDTALLIETVYFNIEREKELAARVDEELRMSRLSSQPAASGSPARLPVTPSIRLSSPSINFSGYTSTPQDREKMLMSLRSMSDEELKSAATMSSPLPPTKPVANELIMQTPTRIR